MAGIMSRLVLSLMLVAGACGPASVARAGLEQGREDGACTPLTLEQGVRRLAGPGESAEALWPGFDPLAIPLAVYDGERTFLFRHPAPPGGFIPVPEAGPAAWACPGRHEAVTANTSAELGGVATATILLNREQPGRSCTDLAAIAIHEAFHVFQRARHPGWMGNEADLFTYPSESDRLLALRRLESEALRRALAAGSADSAACWARQALALRGERCARLDSVFVAYERGTELNEGLATYVELRAAGRRPVDLPPGEFAPGAVRQRAYWTGSALAVLLDRFTPGWPAALEADDRQTLDAALAAALGEGKACAFGEDALADATRTAQADIATLAAERARRLAAFEDRPGWRVVVEAAGGGLLWPQGFDPLNVERLGAERVLHTRFLRLGNGSGQLEVLDAEALTEGAGSHPLFQGVRRVELTGLAEPELGKADGKVTVRARGLDLEFKGARATQSGETITVRLGS
jgi:hypothetical protein